MELSVVHVADQNFLGFPVLFPYSDCILFGYQDAADKRYYVYGFSVCGLVHTGDRASSCKGRIISDRYYYVFGGPGTVVNRTDYFCFPCCSFFSKCEKRRIGEEQRAGHKCSCRSTNGISKLIYGRLKTFSGIRK